jgi:hypothetical protein
MKMSRVTSGTSGTFEKDFLGFRPIHENNVIISVLHKKCPGNNNNNNNKNLVM